MNPNNQGNQNMNPNNQGNPSVNPNNQGNPSVNPNNQGNPNTPIGWKSNGKMGTGSCTVEVPTNDWTLMNTCPKQSGEKVKILTYNLFWWNLFGQRKGNNRSAGILIRDSGRDVPYDVMAFQECDDINRVLKDSELNGKYDVYDQIAWNNSKWELLSKAKGEVGEDGKQQYFGKRYAIWVRLRNKQNGQTLFVLDHHGPLPLHTGGKCGGNFVAYKILQMVGLNAYQGDMIVLAGDFNAGRRGEAIKTLSSKINLLFTGTAIEGIDHLFSNCRMTSSKNLGSGGSDHDALMGIFQS